MAHITKRYEVAIVVVDDIGDNNDSAFVTIQDLNQASSKPIIYQQMGNWKSIDPSSLPKSLGAQIEFLATKALAQGGAIPGGN